MKSIYRILIVAGVILSSMIAPNQVKAQAEASNIGVKTGYVSKNHGLMIGAFYQRSLNEHLRLSPELSYALRNRDLSAINLDLNVHFPLALGKGDCSLYPLAGVDLTRWRMHGIHSHIGDLSKTYTRLGANLGAGFEIYTKRNLKVSAEIKYTITSDFSTLVYGLGIAYFLK